MSKIITAAEMAEHYEPLIDLHGALQKIEALTAENERLREALGKVCLVEHSIMNPIHTIQSMRRIARAALTGKAEQ